MISDTKDATLKAAVLRELRLDPRVNETEIGILVSRGVVTLTGHVETEAERTAAAHAAGRAPGVHDVANEITLRLAHARADDAALAAAVREALEREVGAAAGAVHTNVEDGVVTLSGAVDVSTDADDAVRVAHGVAGVRRVEDDLWARAPMVNVLTLQRSIEKALERRARREADRIEVSAEDGVVTLEGDVDSRSDEHAILELVRHAPGVRRIENRLRVVS
jgi:osmotically-inducible protein OsmY